MAGRAAKARVNWERIARSQIHPVRMWILDLYLSGEEISPVAVQRQLGDVRLGTVSYHVRALLDAGVLELARTEQRRGALAHFYRAAPVLGP